MLRRQRELDSALDLDRADPRLHDVLRLGAYQLRWLTRVPSHAAVSTSVELARQTVGEGVTGYVNHALRKLTGTRSSVSGIRESHPDWLIKRWEDRFGHAETTRLIQWNDAKPDLIVQPARWDRGTLLSKLREAGVEVADAPFDAGIHVLRIADTKYRVPSNLPGFTEGAFIACAAPGGKAVTLEAHGARILAGDARHERIGRLADTARRAGVEIRCVAADLEAAPLRPASVDAVFVDAPCSATGTMRRHPDARWRLNPTVFARAAARQARLLVAAAPLVRPGGLLIYATCSLEPEENEHVVEGFLNQNPEFARMSHADGSVPTNLLTDAGDFQSLPQRHGIDGAYAARLMRVS